MWRHVEYCIGSGVSDHIMSAITFRTGKGSVVLDIYLVHFAAAANAEAADSMV